MFDFFKENIVYISVPFFVLEIASCLFYGMEFAHLLVFLIVLAFSVGVFFLDCMLLNKRRISDTTVGKLCFSLLLSFVFCMLSFIKMDSGYTFISIAAGVPFITHFILIKIFDVKEY